MSSQIGSILDEALALAARGWRIFPLKPKSKTPQINEWQKLGTTNPAQIQAWWNQWPEANVAIATGKDSNLLVLDVDIDEEKGTDGPATLANLEQQYGHCPHTIEVFTGRGGRHLYFQYPKGHEVRNSVGLLGPGLDIRGEGGYVAVPPSIHPDTHRRYEWKVDHNPEETSLWEINEWIIQLLSKKKSQGISPVIDGNTPVKIPEGQRNSYLTSLAGSMRRPGMDLAAIAAALLVENKMKCDPPLPEEEVRSVAKSMMRYPPTALLVPAMHTSFPFADLPPVFRNLTDELSQALPIAPELVACATLVVAAGAIGRSRMIQVKSGWLEPSILWMALVNPAGQIKTPSLSQVTTPVRELQQKAAERYQQEKKEYERNMEIYEAAKYQHRTKQLDELPPMPEKPIMQRFYTVDVTVEKLSSLLQETPRGLLVIRDELTGWVKSMNQYKGGKGADKSFWLSSWAGSSHTVDRQGKDPIFIDHPTVSVVGNIPPTILSELNVDNQGDGFLHRILFCNPDPVKVRWSEQTVSEEAKQAYHQRIKDLSQLAMVRGGFSKNGNADEAKILPLAPEAKKLFMEWHDAHYQKSEDPTFNEELGGYYHKLKGYCARFALIHQLVTDPESEAVGLDSVSFGCDVADYFASQAERIFPNFSRARLSLADKCEAQIRRTLGKNGPMSRRDLQRCGNADATTFKNVLNSLIDIEIVKDQEGKLILVVD